MGRLKQLAPLVRPVGRGVGYLERDVEQDRRVRAPIRKLYSTARWRRLRWQVLVEALFTCARCGRIEHDTSALVADHVEPHRGDEALFWRRDNLQCLCKPCHDGEKQREESGRP